LCAKLPSVLGTPFIAIRNHLKFHPEETSA
jgi:hypothetical protein